MVKTADINWPITASKDLTKTLESFLADENSMPQAYLFLGSSVVGSDARELVHSFAAKISQSEFPNVDSIIYDAADGTNIAGIRELLSLTSLRPLQKGRKVVLMLNMDKANAQMQNAMLKSLESPPEHSVFLMVSDRPMLPTVMSRCQIFTLASDITPAEESTELAEAFQLLLKHRQAGLAEKMVLVQELAALEEELLPELLNSWLQLQLAELKTNPKLFTAVRATAEAIQSLRRNFNKKMVLQQFVTTGLI